MPTCGRILNGIGVGLGPNLGPDPVHLGVQVDSNLGSNPSKFWARFWERIFAQFWSFFLAGIVEKPLFFFKVFGRLGTKKLLQTFGMFLQVFATFLQNVWSARGSSERLRLESGR